MTDAAEQLHRAVVFWAHHMRTVGQPIPDGYAAAARRLVAGAADPPAWLTPAEAADRAGVSVRTLRRWRADGLASTCTGRVVRIRTADLEDYLAAIGGHSRDTAGTALDTEAG